MRWRCRAPGCPKEPRLWNLVDWRWRVPQVWGRPCHCGAGVDTAHRDANDDGNKQQERCHRCGGWWPGALLGPRFRKRPTVAAGSRRGAALAVTTGVVKSSRDVSQMRVVWAAAAVRAAATNARCSRAERLAVDRWVVSSASLRATPGVQDGCGSNEVGCVLETDAAGGVCY